MTSQWTARRKYRRFAGTALVLAGATALLLELQIVAGAFESALERYDASVLGNLTAVGMAILQVARSWWWNGSPAMPVANWLLVSCSTVAVITAGGLLLQSAKRSSSENAIE
jgi:uncharacterized membrane protein